MSKPNTRDTGWFLTHNSNKGQLLLTHVVYIWYLNVDDEE